MLKDGQFSKVDFANLSALPVGIGRSFIQKEINFPANRDKLINSNYFRIYAYTNQFEFLAVILEHYFESPTSFKQEFPQLFNNVSKMLNHKH